MGPLSYTVKKVINFPSLVGISPTKLSVGGIIKFFPSRESLVSDIPAGDRKIANLFLQCNATFYNHIYNDCIFVMNIYAVAATSAAAVTVKAQDEGPSNHNIQGQTRAIYTHNWWNKSLVRRRCFFHLRGLRKLALPGNIRIGGKTVRVVFTYLSRSLL
jgi:hypothetical protein